MNGSDGGLIYTVFSRRRVQEDTTLGRRSQSSRGLQREQDSQYVVSYGGGVNSTALTVLLIEKKFPLDCVVFADTGNEMPETYKYLDVMGKYLERVGVPLEVVHSRSGESLADRCTRRRVIPSEVWRWCTRDMKVTPIHAFYRSLKAHVYQYMGIDYDEVHRMKPARVDYVTNLYPLIDHKIGRDECVDIIKGAGLPVPIKSGCYLCPFNNTERWAYIHDRHPELYKMAMSLEENGKHFGRQNLAPGAYTLRELRELMGRKGRLPVVQVDSPCGGECMV